MPGSICNTWKWICDDLGSNILVFCWSYNYSEWLITASNYMGILGKQVHPVVQMMFPKNDTIFQNDNSPIHIARSVQAWFEEHEDAFQHLPWPAQLIGLNIIEPVWSVLESRARSRFPPPLFLKQLEDVLHEK